MEAKGGEGCLSPIFTVIDAALDLVKSGGVVTAFSDASASDYGRRDAVVARAQSKRTRPQYVVTGSCSPLDPVYEQAANATGGSVIVLEHDADSISASLAIAEASTEAPRTVHTETGTVNTTRSVAFPTETGVNKLTIFANGVLDSVKVTQPSGAPLAAGAGVTISPVLNGYIFVIANPPQGIWQVVFTGAGSYTLSAYVNGAIDFDSIEHNSLLQVGRPGHELRAKLGQTGQTGRVWIKTHVAGARAPLTLDLIRLDGAVISSFPLGKISQDRFEGAVTLPTEAHRFRVRGFAADNTAFARIHGQGNVAPPVAVPGAVVASLATSPTWRAGTVNAFAINLKNLGGDDTVTLAGGIAPSGASVSCSPSSISVPGSQQVNVLCSTYLPEVLNRADFSVTVTSAIANSTNAQVVTIPLRPLKLPLSCALDIDGDNRIDPLIDGMLLTRYLLGFRGNALIDGLTITGPRKTANLLDTFFGSAAQFDVVGRATPSPTAMVDGLLMTRLMLGLDDAALLTGISLPANAQYRTASAIKDYVISRCAGGF